MFRYLILLYNDNHFVSCRTVEWKKAAPCPSSNEHKFDLRNKTLFPISCGHSRRNIILKYLWLSIKKIEEKSERTIS